MAFCGFDCGDCPMYQATISGDDALKDELIKKYSTAERKLTREDILCHGCKADKRYVHPFCTVCAIRTCALEHGIGFNCGECGEYPCHEIITKIPPERSGRKNMDQTHDSRKQ